MTSPKVYTRTGDAGTTSLVNGERVPKSHVRIDAYGSVDELNAVLGVLVSHINTQANPNLDGAKESLLHIQNQLFNVGSQLACSDPVLSLKLPQIGPDQIKKLEVAMDKMSEDLTPLHQFILPGGNILASHAHMARTVARRVERRCCQLAESEDIHKDVIPYLNRLNDYFFVLARYLNQILNTPEVTWEK